MHKDIEILAKKISDENSKNKESIDWVGIARFLKEDCDASMVQTFFVLIDFFKLKENQANKIIGDSNLWIKKNNITEDCYEFLIYSEESNYNF